MPAVEATLRIAPAAAPTIAGQERRGQRDRRLDQHPDLLELARGIGLMKGAAGGKAGVVDEDLDIEPERRRCGPGAAAREAALPRSQPIVSARMPWLGGELCGELVEPVLAPGDEHEVVAAAGELAGDLGADPGRGAGDQRGERRVGRLRLGKAHATAQPDRPPPERGELRGRPVSARRCAA